MKKRNSKQKRDAAPDRACSPGQEAEVTGGESGNRATAGDQSAHDTSASGEIYTGAAAADGHGAAAADGHGSARSKPGAPTILESKAASSRRTPNGAAKCVPERETLLLPYQKRWVEDRSRLKLAEKSRQIGWTWATAYALVRKLSLLGILPVLDEWISSRDELQAKLFIQDLKNWARVLQVGAEDLGETVIDSGTRVDSGTRGSSPFQQSAMAIRFATGAFAYSLSSNADAQAGKRGGRTLDEFALHRDPRRLYAIAYPGITWGGQLSLFSTHRGSANFFNELVQEIKHKGNPKKFSFHRVTLQDALEQGFLHKLQTKLPPDDERQGMDEAAYFDFIRSGCADEETFQQEYMCVPGDDASAFLSYDLIAGCEYKLEERWEWDAAGLSGLGGQSGLYLGVDVGRLHDLTVFWLLEKTGGVCFTRKLICMEKATFESQEAVLYELLSLPALRRACIDRTGIGFQFVERAQQRFGEYKVEAVTFTAPVKEELAYPVRAAFEDRSLRIPNDAKVRSDLRSIRKETTAAGNIRFAADRGPNGHADRFWALALALHAGKHNEASNFLRVSAVVNGRANGMRAERMVVG